MNIYICRSLASSQRTSKKITIDLLYGGAQVHAPSHFRAFVSSKHIFKLPSRAGNLQAGVHHCGCPAFSGSSDTSFPA